MINHEKIFQAIQKKNWEFLIHTLHQNRKDINSDPLLTLAARTFITEFLSDVDNYPLYHLETISNLEMLFVIHQGGFYKINDSEYKKLICEIVKRKNNK